MFSMSTLIVFDGAKQEEYIVHIVKIASKCLKTRYVLQHLSCFCAQFSYANTLFCYKNR